MSDKPKNPPESPDTPSEDEIARRRDEGLRRLLRMPPKPHKEIPHKGRRKAGGPSSKSGRAGKS